MICFDILIGLRFVENRTLGQKSSNFGDTSLGTGAIVKIENTTIPLDKSRCKNGSRVLKTKIPL